MTVPLHVVYPQSGDFIPVWVNFIDCMDARARIKGHNSDVITEARQELSLHGAHTDWTDEQDPIWFLDEDHMIAFVLAYS